MSPPQYSELLLDHYHHPRNAGTLEAPRGHARRENQVCGDVLEMFVRVESGAVTRACFRAVGCIPTIALASYATEWATGRTRDEVAAVRADNLAAALGGLPAHKQHAAELAAEALRAAVEAGGGNS